MQKFLEAWLIWVYLGAKPHSVFTRHGGLCGNAVQYRLAYGVGHAPWENWMSEGLSTNFPFNKSSDDFFNEESLGKCHLNKQRIEFVERIVMSQEQKPQSPELTEYYNVLAQWIIDGCPEGEPFSVHNGMRKNLQSVLPDDPDTAMKLIDEIHMQYLREKLHLIHTFSDEPNEEYLTGKTYQNEKRLAWIETHCTLGQ